MRNIRYKYLLVILSVVLITTLGNLYGQNNLNTYAIRINQEDVLIDKLANGYQIYIKKKGNTAGLKLYSKLPNGNNSYLYINNTGNSNSIVNIKNVDFHNRLGEVFEVFIPETLYLDSRNNNSVFRLSDNINIVLESYDNNGNKLLDNEIVFRINNTNTSRPTITLRNVEKEGDLYAFYLYYSGGNNGEYAFYVREGKTNTAYKLINTSYGSTVNVDNSAIILENTYNRVLGKKLYIKAYFKQLPEDRYLSFNVFNTRGESFTYPIDYVIETTNVKPEVIPPQMPSGGDEGAVPIRPIDKVIETSTNTIIIGSIDNEKKDDPVSFSQNPMKNNSKKEIKKTVKSNDVEIDVIKITDNANNNLKKNNFYNGEAMDALDNASKVFHTPNNYADDENKLPDNLKNIINRYKDFDTIDLVIVLDTTESMHPYIRSIKKEIRGIARQLFDNHKKARIGFMLYRDVKDTYFTKMIDFSDNMNLINREVNYFFASGGGDKAEPMYEAIQEALEKFNFVHNKKLIIVITDAPAKVIGRANLDLNAKTAREKDVTIELVLTSEIEEEDTSDDHLYFLNF